MINCHFRALLPGLALILLMPFAAHSEVSLSLSVNVAPPELPVYVQPPIPGDGYIWTPGYWAWDGGDYYWVPGTWVIAPTVGYLWTPGYWGDGDGGFFWHAGYWGPHIGFYGGVNYGYGYGGRGYDGGYWREGHLYYNRSVNNVGNVHITNVYNKTVINNVNVTRVSYNGGNGGTHARPSTVEISAGRDRHVDVTPLQHQHEQAARGNPALRSSVNKGRPPIAATSRPGEFSGAGVVPAREAGAPRGNAAHADAIRGANPAVNPRQQRHVDGPPARAQAQSERPQREQMLAQPQHQPVQQQSQAQHQPAQHPPAQHPPAQQRQSQAERQPAQQQHQNAPRPNAQPHGGEHKEDRERH